MMTAGKRCAFTLVELLVVIAIIALLLAVALPGLRKVKVSAKRLISANNMRQIGVAVSLYADDHRGFFPLTTHTTTAPEQTWIYTLAAYLGDVDAVRICPADPQGRERLRHNTSSYIVNEYMNPLYAFGQLVAEESFHNLHRLAAPSQTITTFIAADATSPADTNADHVHSRSWFLAEDPESRWTAVISDIQPDRFKTGPADTIDPDGATLFLYADTQVKTVNAQTIKDRTDDGVNFARPAR